MEVIHSHVITVTPCDHLMSIPTDLGLMKMLLISQGSFNAKVTN